MRRFKVGNLFCEEDERGRVVCAHGGWEMIDQGPPVHVADLVAELLKAVNRLEDLFGVYEKVFGEIAVPHSLGISPVESLLQNPRSALVPPNGQSFLVGEITSEQILNLHKSPVEVKIKRRKRKMEGEE